MSSSEIWTWEKCGDAVKGLRGRLGFADSSAIEFLGLEIDVENGTITDKLTESLVDFNQPQGRFTIKTVFFLLSAYSKTQNVSCVNSLIT